MSDVRSLITGVTGQDGWYLSELLRAEGHEVFGLVTADDRAACPPGVRPVRGDLRDSASLRAAVADTQPDEIFNLAAISSVAESWREPELVSDVNGMGVLRLLSIVRDENAAGREVRLVQASSAEIFGDAAAPQDEETPLAPRTPYGAAKAFAHHAISLYRAAGVWACALILFNHESPRRPTTFVTRKITQAVAAIAEGSDEPVVLGNLDARRDWGFAGDYMQAAALAARQDRPRDYVIATGVSHTIRDFISTAFAHVGIDDWKRYVTTDRTFERPVEAGEQRGDPGRAYRELGWRPSVDFAELVGRMVDADREQLPSGSQA